jgi:tetratricopeptide (TPR) repeat protein
LLQRSLATYEQIFGFNHPSQAVTLTNLAAVYFAQKRYEASAATYKRAIVSRTALMGPDDLRWADILERYAQVLRVLEQYAEAEAVQVRATGIRVRNALRGG